MKLTVIDTPGFGDQINNENWYATISPSLQQLYKLLNILTRYVSLPALGHLTFVSSPPSIRPSPPSSLPLTRPSRGPAGSPS